MRFWYRFRLWWHLWRGHSVEPARGLIVIAWTGGSGRAGHYCRTCFGPLGRGKFIAPIDTPFPRGWNLPPEDRDTLAKWREEATSR